MSPKRTCAMVANGNPCHNVATQVITYPDGQRALICGPCAVTMRELAREHATTVKLEPLP